MIYLFLICLVAGAVTLAVSLLLERNRGGRRALRAAFRFVPFFGVGGLVAEGLGSSTQSALAVGVVTGLLVALVAALLERAPQRG